MTNEQLFALLMGLAPEAPSSFQIAGFAAIPDAPRHDDYVGSELNGRARALAYAEGHYETSLAEEAQGLMEWFDNDGSSPEDMNSRSAIDEAIRLIIEQHPGTDEAALRAVGDELVEALGRYAVDRHEWENRRDRAKDDYAVQRDFEWRKRWAKGLMQSVGFPTR